MWRFISGCFGECFWERGVLVELGGSIFVVLLTGCFAHCRR